LPTVLKIGPYRYFFYSGDRDEPVHIHIERDDKIAKIWLDPVRLDNSGGFNRKEISEMLKTVQEHHQEFVEAWHDYFDE
jgi:hypothetical protein